MYLRDCTWASGTWTYTDRSDFDLITTPVEFQYFVELHELESRHHQILSQAIKIYTLCLWWKGRILLRIILSSVVTVCKRMGHTCTCMYGHVLWGDSSSTATGVKTHVHPYTQTLYNFNVVTYAYSMAMVWNNITQCI